MEEKFIELVKRHLKHVDANCTFDANASLKELGLDSISSIHLLIEIEDTYGITMSDEYLTDKTFSTASSLWNEVEKIRKGDA